MEKKFSPHLALAKKYWQSHLAKNDLAIDATCGNGNDTLFLSGLCKVIALDIQEKAIENTKNLLAKNQAQAQVLLLPHEKIDTLNVTPNLIVYNLGYLPTGNKSLTTKVDSTLESIQKGLEILEAKGTLSITCYPGHEEGEREELAILDFVQSLPPFMWTVCHHRWLNRSKSPSLFWVVKKFAQKKAFGQNQ
jgi:hypothetical protein